MSQAAEAPIEGQSRKPVKAGKFLLFVGVAAIAVAVSGIRSRNHDDAQLAQWTDEQAIPTVALIKPESAGGARQVVLPGDVEAFYNASLHGQVKGYVRVWNFDIGAHVRKGDVLAVIDTPELDQQITAAQGELVKAQANLSLAQVTAQRWTSLRGSAAVSQQAADEKEADARAKRAEVEATQANLDRVKALKGFAQIVAPFDGVVTALNVDIGTLVNSGAADSPPLFTISDVHEMRVYVRVPESYAAQIKNGMKATLSLPEFPDRDFTATVSTTSHAIDKKSRSLLVELLADNSEGLLDPGAFARVRFEVPGNPKAVRLPASALVFRGATSEIATLGPDDRVAFKPVRIARDFGSDVEIAGGVSADERIISNPPDSLENGEEVRLSGESDKVAGAPPHEKIAETDRGRAE